MAARDAQGVRRRKDAGPRIMPRSMAFISETSANSWSAQVAHGGEPGRNRAPREAHATQRRVGRRLVHRPSHRVGLEVKRQVGVHVDQAGQERDVAEIDRLSAPAGASPPTLASRPL